MGWDTGSIADQLTRPFYGGLEGEEVGHRRGRRK